MEKKPKVGVGFGVMILNKKERKILLGKRHEDPKKADSELSGEGTWTMPGGKLEFQETFEKGAFREVLEETGIKLKSAKVICINNDMTNKDYLLVHYQYTTNPQSVLSTTDVLIMLEK